MVVDAVVFKHFIPAHNVNSIKVVLRYGMSLFRGFLYRIEIILHVSEPDRSPVALDQWGIQWCKEIQ